MSHRCDRKSKLWLHCHMARPMQSWNACMQSNRTHKLIKLRPTASCCATSFVSRYADWINNKNELFHNFYGFHSFPLNVARPNDECERIQHCDHIDACTLAELHGKKNRSCRHLAVAQIAIVEIVMVWTENASTVHICINSLLRCSTRNETHFWLKNRCWRRRRRTTMTAISIGNVTPSFLVASVHNK